MYKRALIISLFIFSQQLPAHLCKRFAWDDSFEFFPRPKPDDLLSNIKFLKNKPDDAIIKYAGIEVKEPLKICPMDTMPDDLKQVVGELLAQAKKSVQSINDARKGACASIANQLDQTQAEVNNAVRSQYFVSSSLGSNSPQNTINNFTRQAVAVNQMGYVGANFLKNGCVINESNGLMFQRLIGQALTLGGLFLGGWEGIGIASFGQLFSALPLFRDKVEQALKEFQKYAEQNEKIIFLCWYRQMLKVSAMLFAKPDATVLSGFDLSFETGPARTTINTLAEMKQDDGDAFRDIELLADIHKKIMSIVMDIEPAVQSGKEPWSTLKKLKAWCDQAKLKDSWQEVRLLSNRHPINVREATIGIQESCQTLTRFSWPNRDEMPEFLEKAHQALFTVDQYYLYLLDNEEEPLGKIARTLQSMDFFNKTRSTMYAYRNSQLGNQMRLNYRNLSERLGKGLAKRSFKKLMDNYERTIYPHLRLSYVNLEKRRRILQAMITTCQTFDPTITGFGVDDRKKNPFFKEWKKKCVGPKSSLCKRVLGKKDEQELLKDYTEADRKSSVYFYSLCGRFRVDD